MFVCEREQNWKRVLRVPRQQNRIERFLRSREKFEVRILRFYVTKFDSTNSWKVFLLSQKISFTPSKIPHQNFTCSLKQLRLYFVVVLQSVEREKKHNLTFLNQPVNYMCMWRSQKQEPVDDSGFFCETLHTAIFGTCFFCANSYAFWSRQQQKKFCAQQNKMRKREKRKM